MRYHRKTIITVLAFALVIGVSAALVANWVLAEDGPSDIPFQAEPAPEDVGFEYPTLTADQISAAEETMLSDHRAAVLLSRSSYTFEALPGVDSESEAPNELVGIAFLITFDEPISIEGTWLLKHPPAPGDPLRRPQEVLEYKPDCAAPNGIKRAIAQVDLRHGLVQFEPTSAPLSHPISIRDYCPGDAR